MLQAVCRCWAISLGLEEWQAPEVWAHLALLFVRYGASFQWQAESPISTCRSVQTARYVDPWRITNMC